MDERDGTGAGAMSTSIGVFSEATRRGERGAAGVGDVDANGVGCAEVIGVGATSNCGA